MSKRPALRYFGSKWKISKWIIGHFPAHKLYVEPFGGSASTIIRKNPSFIEVYNDIDGDVVNFFRILRTRPADLVRVIELTPFARDEYLLCDEPCEDELERARRFFVRSWQTRGQAGAALLGGWRNSTTISRPRTHVQDWNNTTHLYWIAERLKKVQIENDDAMKVINRYDGWDSLFLIDPPYLHNTRADSSKLYKHDYSEGDHIALAGQLQSVEGMVIVCGYDNELYDDLYASWKRVELQVSLENGRRVVTEYLWINPQTQKVKKQMSLLF